MTRALDLRTIQSVRESDLDVSSFRPVRAILASEFWPGATARGIVPGLRDAGWLVDEIDIRQYVPPGHDLRSRVEGRLRNRERVSAFQRAILASAQVHDPAVFLTVKGIALRQATLAALRQRGTFLVNYYPDRDVAMDHAHPYDLFVTTKSYQLDYLRRELGPTRVHYVPHGYAEGMHRPLPTTESERENDILYIGNANAEKAALLSALTSAMPNRRIKIIGSGWDKIARGAALHCAIIGSSFHGDYYAAEIARAKIVLAFHWGANPKTGLADLVSTRSFEIPACGGFMLHIDNGEIRSLYDVPSEIDTFVSPEELIAKCLYWLANPVERQAVAARGHARAVPAYSYFERGRELARLVEERLENR